MAEGNTKDMTKRVGRRKAHRVSDAEVEYDQKNHKSWRARAGKRLVFGSWPAMPWKKEETNGAK